jgi:archaellum biogenesis ATPase FlaH
MTENFFLSQDYYLKKSTSNRRNIDAKNLCTWGVDFLDEHFGGGIPPRSFNLIACESGRGKTTLVSGMATANSIKGKKIAFIRLEGDLFDFPDTEKWKIIYPELKKRKQHENLDYQSYRLNNIPNIEDLEEIAEAQLKKTLENVLLFDKQTMQVNKKTINRILNSALQWGSDLIIIDHLHYFDIIDDNQKWAEQLATVKAVNEFVDKYEIPVVLVSHVRKQMTSSKSSDIRLLKMDDIQGSSDIFKIAHTVLFMSPNYQDYDHESKRYSTLFYSPKSRYGASTTSIGIKVFNGMSKQYEPGYEIADQKLIKGEWVIERRTYGTNNF